MIANGSKSTSSKVTGVISSHEVYTTAEFRRRTGFKDFAWRELLAAGLPVIRLHKKDGTPLRKAFVRGSDWHAFLETQREVSDET